jgi:hypothetical protein
MVLAKAAFSLSWSYPRTWYNIIVLDLHLFLLCYCLDRHLYGYTTSVDIFPLAYILMSSTCSRNMHSLIDTRSYQFHVLPNVLTPITYDPYKPQDHYEMSSILPCRNVRALI